MVFKWYILPIGGLYGTDPTYYGNQETPLSIGSIVQPKKTPPPRSDSYSDLGDRQAGVLRRRSGMMGNPSDLSLTEMILDEFM